MTCIKKKERLLTSRIFQVERLDYATTDGDLVTKDIVRHPGSVAIVPRLTDGTVCLIQNHRLTVDRSLIEIPAGTLEPGESPLACAHRELIEETGFSAGRMEFLRSFYPAPGMLDEQMHLFFASDLTPGDSAREAGEQIDNLVVRFEEALQFIDDGRIEDAKTIIGLWLAKALWDEKE